MSRTEPIWVARAHAKLNLFLEVLGRRANGYHDIRSIVVPISLHDTVTLRPTAGDLVVEMECSDPGGAWDDLGRDPFQNLAWRAAQTLRTAVGVSEGAHIRIEKAIPMGGGLGGGSADAAAVLIALNRIWGAGLSREALMTIGAGLGCDIPALVHGGAVRVEGLGETVGPIPCRRAEGWWVALVNPRFSVLTRDIYRRCDVPLTRQDEGYKSMLCAVEEGDLDRASACLFNGLQPVVFRKYPLIAILAEELRAAGAVGVLLAGSGATVLGLARDEGHARALTETIERACDVPLWTAVVRTVPDGVMAAHGPLEARV